LRLVWHTALTDHSSRLVRETFRVSQGFAAPISYVDTVDIQASKKALVDAGAEVVQDMIKVAPGLVVARLKDADGNYLGLRQFTE
jgi:predicted enzyme related to lactoylglutathione lyase